MNGNESILAMLFGAALAAISFAINLPYVTLTLLLAGYTLTCDHSQDGKFLASFLLVLAVLYNLKLHGIL